MDQLCLPCRPVFSTRKTVGRELPSIAKKGHLCRRQEFDLTHQSIPAPELSASTRTATVSVRPHTEWIGILQRFDRSVQRVGHVAVNAIDAIHVRTRTHTAGSGLVVCERGVRAMVSAAYLQIV